MARRRKNRVGLQHTVRSSLNANREHNMKKSAMKAAGKKAYQNGRTLERRLEALQEYYQNADKFECEFIRNFDALNKAKGRRGGLTAYTTGISSCDFSFWCGESIGFMAGMIEAKSRSGNRINKNAVSVHQREQLWRLEKLGQYGFVCVSMIDADESVKIYIVPIKNWYRGHKKSLNSTDLEAIGYRCNMVLDPQTQLLVPDILEVLRDVHENGIKDVPKAYKGNNFNKKEYDTIYKEFEKLYGGETLDVDPDDDEIDVD